MMRPRLVVWAVWAGWAAWVGLALVGCADMAGVLASQSPGDARLGEAAMRVDSQRFIVLVVANPLDSPSGRAGSSLSGYAAVPRYTAGSRAAVMVAELQRDYPMREATSWPIPSLNWHCVVFELAPQASREVVLAALAGDARVQLVQPLQDFEVRASEGVPYNDPYLGLQRGFAQTDVARAHRLSVGRGVHVAVIDTGADTTHPDLQGRIQATYNLVDGDAVAFAQDRHGTEVAGVIAAVGNNLQGIVGVAPEARLSIYKACWYAPGSALARCNSFTLAKAS